MPSFPFSRAMTANQTGLNPLTDWQFERVPNSWVQGAECSIMVRSTDANVRVTIYSGSQTIVQRAPVQAGGTAGVTPSPLNTPVFDWIGAPDDKLIILLDNTTAGTPTVDGIISVDPI